MTKDLTPTTGSMQDLPVELRNEPSTRLARRTTYIIAATVIVLIGWAAISPIEEVAVASGKIVPQASISDVHHFEGGIVDRVVASEGDTVKKGDVLVRLSTEQTVADLSQLEARIANLKLKQARLTASLEGKEPEFGAVGQRYPKLETQQRQTFEKDREQAKEEKQQLRLAVQRITEQQRSARNEAESLAEQVRLQSEQVSIREKSHERGYTSKHTLLQARATLEQTRQSLVSTRGRIAELGKMLDEARTKLRETLSSRLHKLAEERSEVAAELAEAEETLKKHRDRVQRLELTAPIDGVVHSMSYKVQGEVIKPGALVAQIVPADSAVMAEVELKPHDIGHVRVGNSAELKLSNYDPNVVGIIRGQVKRISPTTFEDPDGKPFYRVRISLDRQRLELAGRDYPISPGTTLNAQILTGSKTLMRYMLKPVYQSFDTAFAER